MPVTAADQADLQARAETALEAVLATHPNETRGITVHVRAAPDTGGYVAFNRAGDNLTVATLRWGRVPVEDIVHGGVALIRVQDLDARGEIDRARPADLLLAAPHADERMSEIIRREYAGRVRQT